MADASNAFKLNKPLEAMKVFYNSEISITGEGTHYLGTAVNSDSFVTCIQEKIKLWVNEIKVL